MEERVPLSKIEIKQLISVLEDTFSYLNEIKGSKEIAKYLQYPKIPKALSESICFYLIEDGKILQYEKGNIKIGKESDLVLENEKGNIKIEVKATGKSAFQYFGPKDITCNYLIWMHFGSYFHDPDYGNIEVYVLKDPEKYFKEPQKITLRDFIKKPVQRIEIGNI